MSNPETTRDDWWLDAKNAEEIRDRAEAKIARQRADRIFALDAQYQGGIIKAANRDDFIDRYIVPILMGRVATDA